MDRPLKLAICSWCYGIGGGAARMETYYHQFYNRKLFEPHIISLVKRPESGPEYDTAIPFIPVNQKDRFSHLLKILEDFDVIQFQGSFDPLVCEVSRFIKRPHILVEVLHNIEQGGLYPGIDGIICVSNAVAKMQASGRNYKVILNGINTELFPFFENEKPADKIILLQVARRSKVAINLDELSEELCAYNSKIEIWIAGDFVGESTDKVKFLGIREDIADLYRSAHFSVLLSKEEPFGLVALESMAAGTPVVVSKSGGFLDIITDDSCGFLVEGPTREDAIRIIKKAVDTLGTQQYKGFVDKGRTQIEEKFSIKKCIRQYEDYILELYKTKEKKDISVPLTKIPPHAIVGEALYDLHANNLEMLGERLRLLAFADEPITESRVLTIAHRLCQTLKYRNPSLLPREFIPYLFCSGDRTEYTCNEMLNDIEFVKQHHLYEHLFNYFKETKDLFPERWERIKNF